MGKHHAYHYCVTPTNNVSEKSNKTGYVCITQHCDVFAQPMLQWKSNNYFSLHCCVTMNFTKYSFRCQQYEPAQVFT
jgi:hypothetical protein